MQAYIDPHIHFFDLARGQYEWLQQAEHQFIKPLQAQQRWCDSERLAVAGLSLAGLVHIEAGFDNTRPWRELAWLSEIALPCPLKAIACLDITLPHAEFCRALDHFVQYPFCAGIRWLPHNVDHREFGSQNTIENLAMLSAAGLILEVQPELNQLIAYAMLAHLLQKVPRLKIVLNHAGFPDNSTSWTAHCQALGRFEQMSVKCSGWEMLQNPPDKLSLVNQLCDSFGTQRVMLASNFPLCLDTESYASLWQHYAELKFKASFEQLALLNTQHCYGFVT